MKRFSRSCMIAMLLLAVAGGLAGWTWQRATSVPTEVQAKGDCGDSKTKPLQLPR